MVINGLAQIGLFFLVLVALVKPLGWYMSRVYTRQACGIDWVVGPLERLIYRVCGVRETEEMNWKTYAVAMLLFNVTGLVVLYALQRLQGFLPLNPAAFGRRRPTSRSTRPPASSPIRTGRPMPVSRHSVTSPKWSA